MLALTGYADRISVAPGETIEFKVSSDASAPYSARLVRVVCGDPNPAGPGIVEIDVPAPFAGEYPSRSQPVRLGSYARVEDAPALRGLESVSLVATIWPTTPAKSGQAVIAKWDAARAAGIALVLDGEHGMTAIVGDGTGRSTRVAVGKALRTRAWYHVWASLDAERGILVVGQSPLAEAFEVDDAGRARAKPDFRAALDTNAPLLVAALGGDPVGGHFNGKIERPLVLARAVRERGALSAARGRGSPRDTVLRLDFAREMSGVRAVDAGPNRLDGALVNLPVRGMKGSRWTGEEMSWRHAPEQYAAIHFHDDDVHDCGWETDFSFTVPHDLRSGVYAARLRCGDVEDMIPFYVRPPRGRATSDVCYLASTFTHVIYGNYSRNVTTEQYKARAREWDARPWNPDEHKEYGLSTYNFHSDGSGICYSSRLRPLMNMRSGFLSYYDAKGSGLRHFPADTHILAWLEHEGVAFDVVTDEDLDEEGADLLARYKVVLTSTHPEYHTPGTLDAIEEYAHRRGGRLMYLGGNGFYWRVARNPDVPGVIEIRRGEGGIRAWAAEPGEYFNAFDGQYGGMWRRNDRPPQRLAGVGFSGQGQFEGSYYRRMPGADDPRAAWILDGVDGEIIGDFGLSGGGAAGFELDRVDHRLGSPGNTIMLARSEGHQSHFVLVPEEILTHTGTWPGEDPQALIRAEIVYFETANGGAVFSVGSITFCGSLPHQRFDNQIARMLRNVLNRFRGE